MRFEFTLLDNPMYIDFPQGLMGWIGWLIMLGVLLALIGRRIAATDQRPRASIGMRMGVFILLLILVPFTGLFFGIRLPAGDALPLPGRPVEPTASVLMPFIVLPMIFSAGLLGSVETALIGISSGLLLSFWDTHSPFTPLEFGLLAVLLSAAFYQRYRSLEFRLLRNPFFAAIVLSLVAPAVFLFNDVFFAGGSLANRLDYAITRLPFSTLAMAGELLIASLFALMLKAVTPRYFGAQETTQPSPMERSLPVRLIYTMAPLAILLLVALISGNWIFAGRAAREMIQSRMTRSAEMDAEMIPFFIETGQNLIQQISQEPIWYTSSPETQLEYLKEIRRETPFFEQIFLIDTAQNTVAGYPSANFQQASPAPEEIIGVELALKGVPVQNYTIPPIENGTAARMSFIAAIFDMDGGSTRGVLVGRTDMADNPFTRPLIANLESFAGPDGTSMLLDSDGRILYSTRMTSLMEAYQGKVQEEATFFEDTAPDGTRQLVYSQPAVGYPWTILLAVPARQAQQLALSIASPMLVMILVTVILAGVMLSLGLRFVTRSLENLALEANRIATGQLDHPLAVSGVDEVGRLGSSFERMRLSLKARLDELNRLLVVSQGVAASLEMEESVKPVLESALTTGACSARIVLTPAALPEVEGETPYPTRFGMGPSSEQFSNLDDQILILTRQQDKVVLNNLSRVRLVNFTPGSPRPDALLALSMRHENTFYGVLWLAYDRPHQFSEDEVRFMTTLAGQTALAATNARLFLNAEIGRQRLAGILASTPDPVLVTDPHHRLLLANPAAWQVLGLSGESSQGQPIDQIIFYPELVSLLRSASEDKRSIEITASGGRVYLATASSVLAGGRRVGRVCVMRDVTHFKELDALKSDFVATVSHDLRSPLTLIRGYATMLEMVGELNEQQTNYVKKIVASVEAMARLVNNLLDLGRIEAGIDLQLELASVYDIVERVIGTMQLTATQKQVHLNTQMPDYALPLVEVDQALMQQALNNLVENAIKYTDSGGKVTVKVTSQDEFVVFEVSDTGIGIAPVDQPRLFEKFYRGAQRDARKRKGTGLGLAIVKSIAERHNGRVWVESQLGKGSTFKMTIPVKQPKKGK